MSSSSWPTRSAEALSSFVERRGLLRSYMFSGPGDDLQRAKSSFSDAERSDPEFALAAYYVAVADSDLRDSDTAIARLESLALRPVDFLPETYLQLAYAHTTKYRDSHYFEAEEALNRAYEQAQCRHRGDLVLLIEACRTFLYSVMGGRLKEGDRKAYLEKAIVLGESLLVEKRLAHLAPYDRDQVLFQVHNSLSIAYVRKGEAENAFSAGQDEYWELADNHFAAALKLRPDAPRVLQNIGTLLRIKGDEVYLSGKQRQAGTIYLAAQAVYLRSLDLNRHDQFPHSRMADLAAKLGDWDTATMFYESGLKEKGEVSHETWDSCAGPLRTETRVNCCSAIDSVACVPEFESHPHRQNPSR